MLRLRFEDVHKENILQRHNGSMADICQAGLADGTPLAMKLPHFLLLKAISILFFYSYTKKIICPVTDTSLNQHTGNNACQEPKSSIGKAK